MSIASRKEDHIRHALAQEEQVTSLQSDVTFVHHSFPGVAVKDVDLSVNLFDHHFPLPFYINGMTGGSDQSFVVNDRLSQVAAKTGLAMASGSMSAALKSAEHRDSYEIIRKNHPDGFLMANLGPDYTVSEVKMAIELINANALQIHVNATQELVMPEGDRDFTHWLSDISQLVDGLDVPIIVKEVGFGMSRETIHQLYQIGVQYVDVSGQGGTNFARIENLRRKHLFSTDWERWGISTPLSLLEAASLTKKPTILASGGISTPFDVVKSLALGAKAVGVSGHWLKSVMTTDVAETITEVKSWEAELKEAFALLGAKSVKDLTFTDIVFSPEIINWAKQRQLPYQNFNQRRQTKEKFEWL
ncbi:MAG: type 2 isopentenyl-diphosphate Delta-isomerase [Bavariicoccus seileri]|uniref:type 2 isopentenyl-diphosphate Delta-isomerase n=1 Tax=Bavariicoccus seileri TaxID=549685 RepID=UPI003F96F6FB